MDEGSYDKWAKAPQCSWSPIPPADLRRELLKDLNTNVEFISFTNVEPLAALLNLTTSCYLNGIFVS